VPRLVGDDNVTGLVARSWGWKVAAGHPGRHGAAWAPRPGQAYRPGRSRVRRLRSVCRQ